MEGGTDAIEVITVAGGNVDKIGKVTEAIESRWLKKIISSAGGN